MKSSHRLLILAILSVSVALGRSRTSPKLAPEFQEVDSNQMVDVIVKYKDEPSDFQRSKATRRGRDMVRSLDIIVSHHYRIPASQLAELAEDPSVEFVHPNRAVQAAGSVQPDYGWVGLLHAKASGGRFLVRRIRIACPTHNPLSAQPQHPSHPSPHQVPSL